MPHSGYNIQDIIWEEVNYRVFARLGFIRVSFVREKVQ